MSKFLALQALVAEGCPNKEIARRLVMDVRTVRSWRRRIEAGETRPERRKPPRKLDRYEAVIRAKVEAGLSAVQIYQDLRKDPDFSASYETVKRKVRELRPPTVEVCKRLEFRPGEEAQVDFGEVGRMRLEDGVVRRVFVCVVMLCWSRYSWHELVLDQSVATFQNVLRHAFEDFGGVPARLRLDNLRAGVLVNRLGERYYQADFFRFCRHYGTVPSAARPRTPTDKGRVERVIGYVKRSCFGGRGIDDLAEARAWLARWRREVALVRVHGTTGERPVDRMEEERKALRPLPETPWEIGRLHTCRVRRDCHVQVGGNFYSVPWRYVGQVVLVREADGRLDVMAGEQVVARHRLAEGRGRSVTDPGHYPPTKRPSTQEIHRRRVAAIREAGPHARDVLGRLRSGPMVFGSQVAALHRLLREYGPEAVERACARALHFDAADSAARIRRILEKGLHLRPLPAACLPVPAGGYGHPLAGYDALLPPEGP